ncbi:putative histidine kinase, Protein-serine/threonine phosphatase [Helianthus anomalus]
MRALSKLIYVNSPDLVLFVGEALVGNDAVDQLSKFNQKLADLSPSPILRLIDGILLTKFDTIDDKDYESQQLLNDFTCYLVSDIAFKKWHIGSVSDIAFELRLFDFYGLQAFDVESLVENLPGQLAGNQEIIVKVYHVTNTSDPLIMYDQQTQEGDPTRVHVNRLSFGDPYMKHHMTCRYLHEAPISRTAIITARLGYVIVILVGYMFYTRAIHIIQVEDDFNTMQKLKVLAEAYDVAKSQVNSLNFESLMML